MDTRSSTRTPLLRADEEGEENYDTAEEDTDDGTSVTMSERATSAAAMLQVDAASAGKAVALAILASKYSESELQAMVAETEQSLQKATAALEAKRALAAEDEVPPALEADDDEEEWTPPRLPARRVQTLAPIPAGSRRPRRVRTAPADLEPSMSARLWVKARQASRLLANPAALAGLAAQRLVPPREKKLHKVGKR